MEHLWNISWICTLLYSPTAKDPFIPCDSYPYKGSYPIWTQLDGDRIEFLTQCGKSLSRYTINQTKKINILKIRTPIVLRRSFMVIDLLARVLSVVLVVHGRSPVVHYPSTLCNIMCPLWYLWFNQWFFDTFVVMCMVVSLLCSPIFCVVGFVLACFPYVLRGVGLWRVFTRAAKYPSTLRNIKCPLWLIWVVNDIYSTHTLSCASLLLSCDDLLLVSRACVMDFAACVVWCWLVRGFQKWLDVSFYFVSC
jgi:hypothetical protein